MKSLKALVLAAAVLTLPLTAQAGVDVTFGDSAKFTDANLRGYRSAKDRDQVMRTLKRHIELRAARYVAPGQDLSIRITDIDLAGRTNNFFNPNDIRLMTAIDAPAITLTYALTENGRTVTSGEERVIDMNYLMGVNWYGSSDQLSYEKEMLNDWFAKRFAKR